MRLALPIVVANQSRPILSRKRFRRWQQGPTAPVKEYRVIEPSPGAFGLDFTTLGAAEIARLPARRAGRTRRRGAALVTSNVDHIVCLRRNAAFRAAYRSALHRHRRRHAGLPLCPPARQQPCAGALPGSDLIALLLDRFDPAPATGRSSSAPTCAVADAPRRAPRRPRLRRRRRRLRRAAFGFEEDAAYSRDLAGRIRGHGTTHLVLGVGAPKSEIWAHRHRRLIGALLRPAGRRRPRIRGRPEAPRAGGLAPRRPRMGLARCCWSPSASSAATRSIPGRSSRRSATTSAAARCSTATSSFRRRRNRPMTPGLQRRRCPAAIGRGCCTARSPRSTARACATSRPSSSTTAPARTSRAVAAAFPRLGIRAAPLRRRAAPTTPATLGTDAARAPLRRLSRLRRRLPARPARAAARRIAAGPPPTCSPAPATSAAPTAAACSQAEPPDRAAARTSATSTSPPASAS